jgi:GntR family transcriptional regulator, transcriptional repressor for pyruvate dehydrogenase complex
MYYATGKTSYQFAPLLSLGDDGLIKRTPLVEQVTQSLAHRIMALEGDAMLPSERDLARETGVSRPVLREAIRNLQMQGLVEVKHGVGVKAVNKPHRPVMGAFELVTSQDKTRLAQFSEARRVIEPGVAYLAAQRATKGQIRSLRINIQEHAISQEVASAVELDLDFHRQVAQAAGNTILLTILDALADLGRQTRSLSMKAFGVAYAVKSAVEHHTQVLDAIQAGDAPKAQAVMKIHLEGAHRDLESSSPAPDKTKPVSKGK